MRQGEEPKAREEVGQNHKHQDEHHHVTEGGSPAVRQAVSECHAPGQSRRDLGQLQQGHVEPNEVQHFGLVVAVHLMSQIKKIRVSRGGGEAAVQSAFFQR